MILVERENNLKVFRELLAGCRTGHGHAVVVAGAPATGKTTLTRVFTRELADGGIPVHMATGSVAERDVPFGVLRQLFPGLSSSFAGSPEGEDGCQRVCDLLAEESREGPVVIVVDDAHQADQYSLDWLLYLIRRLGSLPVLVVLNESVGKHALQPRVRVELLRQLWVTRMALTPLSPEGVRTLLEAEVGPEATASDATALAEISGGNPLLVEALIEDYLATGEFQAASSPGHEALGHAVLTCLYAGGQETLEVAKALAVLADTASSVPVSGLVDLPVEAVARSVRLLAGAGLLRQGRFRHPLLCRAVLEHVDATARAELHARAAQVLHDDGHEAREVAKHLVSTDLGGRPWVASVLSAAAEAATADRRYEFALQCLQRALDVVEDQRHRATIITQQMRVQWNLNPKWAKRYLGALTEALREGHLSRGDTAYLVRCLVWFGRPGPAAEALSRLGESTGTLDERELAELQSTRLWLRSWCPALLESGVDLELPQPQRADARSGSLTARPRMAGLMKPLADNGSDATTVRRAEETLNGALSDGASLQAAHCALLALLHADRVDVAEHWCALLLRQDRCADEPTREAILLGVRAEIALRQGELTAANEYATAALGRISADGWGVGIGSPLSVLVAANSLLGNVEAATKWLAHEVPESLYESTFGLMYLRARGVHYLSTSRPRAALGAFLHCGELAVNWHLDLPGFLPWRTDAANAYWELNEQDRFRELVHAQFERPGGGRRRSRAAGLRMMAAAAGGRQGLALLRESIDLAEAAGDRVELVRGLVQLSQRLREVGELDKAALLVRRAKAVSDGNGLMSLCSRLLDRAGVTVPGEQEDLAEVKEILPVLSDAERRVAALAALGSTNREIGHKLYITVSTVEQHLTRVYRKLNVKRRADLRSMLHNSGIIDVALAAGR